MLVPPGGTDQTLLVNSGDEEIMPSGGALVVGSVGELTPGVSVPLRCSADFETRPAALTNLVFPGGVLALIQDVVDQIEPGGAPDPDPEPTPLPWVHFDGEYITNIAGANANGQTLVVRFKLANPPGAGSKGLFSAALIWHDVSPYWLYTSWYDTSFNPVINYITDGLSGRPLLEFVPGVEYSLMIAIDRYASMDGSRSASIWLDGSFRAGSVTVPTNTIYKTDRFMDSNSGVDQVYADVQAIWISNSVALDPAAHWNAFFDEDNEFIVSTDEGGVVASATPHLFLGGNASVWNAGIDLAGNSYTMNGVVTDA